MRRTTAVLCLLGLAATTGTEAYPEERTTPRHRVLVELFTSQG